ncbi:MAG: hypothetical protein AABY30_05315 [Candidatus Thermoplasmatota archaeon]
MTRIDKYTLDRLRNRGLRLTFDCPHCQGTKLELRGPAGPGLDGVTCFKCKAVVVLDGLSLTVIREVARPSEG